jgi:ribosomal protein S18 acetylase RimI-like enzyme
MVPVCDRPLEPVPLETIVRLEEDRLRCSIADVTDHAEPWAGGILSAGPPGTWLNAAIGAGVDPVPDGAASDEDEVERLISFHERRGVEPRIELAPQTRASLLDAVAARGFVLRRFLHLFARDLMERPLGSHRTEPDGISIAPVSAENEEATRSWATLSARNFAPARAPGEADIEIGRRIVRHPRCIALGAWAEGELVGGAAFEIGPGPDESELAARHGRIAALFGAAVEPDFRRRGIQKSLIEHRLRLAAERGIRFATVSSHPDIATERTARRCGFELVCTKAVLVRPGPGLIPVAE